MVWFTARRILVGFWLVSLLGCSEKPSPEVTLREASVSEFEKAVESHKGRVVLIDVWFYGWSPCKEKFPHLVQMHQKYQESGLTCISVDVVASELDNKDKVLGFLKKMKADFPNFIFKDSEKNVDAWQEKFGIQFTPAVVIFDRKGQRVSISVEAEAEEVELTIRKLLDEK